MAITLVHDRHMSRHQDPKMLEVEAFHWYRATSTFSQALQRPPQGDEATALLTTAALLGCLSISNIQASTPEDAWPYSEQYDSNLTWLKMSSGKKEVWKLTQQHNIKPTPLFKKLSVVYTGEVIPDYSTNRPSKIEAGLPPYLFNLLNPHRSNSSSEESDDPLEWAAGRLAMILGSDTAPPVVILGFLLLISSMRYDFKQMLIEKDPRALTLLAYWYTRVSSMDLWWLTQRSVLEGMSICLYLEHEYPHDVELQKLLEYPKNVFLAYREKEGSWTPQSRWTRIRWE
jgi:hypothetical protein